MKDQPLTFLDIETTGLSPFNGDGIIEIAGQKVLNGEIIGEFQKYVDCGVPISPGASAVNGITNEFIAENGEPVDEVIPAFLDFVTGSYLVGHNIVKFDFPFIKKHALDLGITGVDTKLIDTLHIARKKLRLRSYRLQALAEHYGIPYINAHTALGDVLITKEVFFRMMEDEK